MLTQGMHAARANQADDVQRAVLPTCVFDQPHESGNAEELASVNRLRYAHDILRHDAARAQVQVTDFAVPDLPVGQSDGEARCFEQRTGGALPQLVPHWRAAELDRVPLAARTKAPAVEHDEDDPSARAMRRCHIEGDAS